MRVDPWWHNSVGYSLYLRSFADADGDGVGDLAGASAHLDHLRQLGVDLIWMSPFYPSPLADFGYDITDHTAVDPVYGDLAAFDDLLHEVHQRDMRLLIDLVPNHTSIEHPWFRQARNDLEGPFRDYYLWSEPGPDGGVPNNWVSYFGGPAWTLDPQSGQYYLHLFLPDQPDLNWRNPAVREEFDRVLRFWLDRGVDGFRVDVAQGLVVDRQLRSNPQLRPLDQSMNRIEQWQTFDHVYDIAQPESHEVFDAWRALCADHEAVLIGETSVGTAGELGALLSGAGLDVGFWLRPAQIGWDAEQIRDALTAPLRETPDPRAVAWAASTLDEKRPATRFGSGELGRQRALALSTLLFFLPGLPFLYQGEELGLIDGLVAASQRADPVGYEVTDSRDGCRTPMPWAPGPSFGFSSSAETWLPMGGRNDSDTASYQRGRSGSWFERYRTLIELRRSTPELRGVDVDPWDLGTDELIAFRRADLAVVANLGGTPISVELSGDVLYNTHDTLDTTADGIVLQEAQAIVVETIST